MKQYCDYNPNINNPPIIAITIPTIPICIYVSPGPVERSGGVVREGIADVGDSVTICVGVAVA